MNMNYSDLNLNQAVKNEILRLLGSIDHNKDDLEAICQLMDMVWDEMSPAGNRKSSVISSGILGKSGICCYILYPGG